MHVHREREEGGGRGAHTKAVNLSGGGVNRERGTKATHEGGCRRRCVAMVKGGKAQNRGREDVLKSTVEQSGEAG